MQLCLRRCQKVWFSPYGWFVGMYFWNCWGCGLWLKPLRARYSLWLKNQTISPLFTLSIKEQHETEHNKILRSWYKTSCAFNFRKLILSSENYCSHYYEFVLTESFLTKRFSSSILSKPWSHVSCLCSSTMGSSGNSYSHFRDWVKYLVTEINVFLRLDASKTPSVVSGSIFSTLISRWIQ